MDKIISYTKISLRLNFFHKFFCENPKTYWEGPLSFTTATVNIHQNNLENLVFYPNPMGENLNIISQNEVFEIAIFNLTGQKILTHKMHNNIGAIDVSYLTSGTYLMQVISESGETSFLKLIKK